MAVDGRQGNTARVDTYGSEDSPLTVGAGWSVNRELLGDVEVEVGRAPLAEGAGRPSDPHTCWKVEFLATEWSVTK